ncbi:hypothetical protein CDA09_19140 [Azoarcus sp. DN11]|nr:hypothetical protein CDA09_19140 [Azoarcus sp. DN11]
MPGAKIAKHPQTQRDITVAGLAGLTSPLAASVKIVTICVKPRQGARTPLSRFDNVTQTLERFP